MYRLRIEMQTIKIVKSYSSPVSKRSKKGLNLKDTANVSTRINVVRDVVKVFGRYKYRNASYFLRRMSPSDLPAR